MTIITLIILLPGDRHGEGDRDAAAPRAAEVLSVLCYVKGEVVNECADHVADWCRMQLSRQ